MEHHPQISQFLVGKSQHTISLYYHFVNEYERLGQISVEATKTMIGISNGHKRIAWVTQLGKNFIHVVFPLREPHYDNLCFQKVAQVPGSSQFNHHLRVLNVEDINDEVIKFMRIAYEL
jgi:hypothetical protein